MRIVVLVSAWHQYLHRGRVRPFFGQAGADPERVRAGLGSLRRTIRAIRATGRRVVIVQSLPRAFYDVGLCNERRAAGRLILGHAGCLIDPDDPRSNDGDVRRFVSAAARVADVGVISFHQALCQGRWCRSTIDGVSLYQDEGHFSPAGARLFARRLHLLDRIRTEAR